MINDGPLTRSFYARPALEVARDLLGRHLVRVQGDERLVGRIVETEAYGGTEDSASHAARGLTPRNAPMFGPPGHAYVYLIYGIHDMFNLVTESSGHPGAVLLRALVPITGETSMIARRSGKNGRNLANGPGKLTQAMGITLAELNRHDICQGKRLWLEQGTPVEDSHVIAGPRIGIPYAESKDREAPWRLRYQPNSKK
ncbi:DNA-3-methyladenine glycosylase [Halomonas sp. M20]|uniref:DNA-3-methyladenine glycosylase n=1 Tax=Halomonas sp. M20 TaxID=2763264 RepID=UPI001D0A8402|nr:DNA-3-methyladenine glycosylase [Halomonas sp. M20]